MMTGCRGTLKSVELNKLVHLDILIRCFAKILTNRRRNKFSPIDFDKLKNLSSQPSYSQDYS